MRYLFAALVAVLFAVPAGAQIVPNAPVVLRNQIVCESPEEIRAFFDKAMEMEGEGIRRALIAANKEGIACLVANGVVGYVGVAEEFVFAPDHRELDVTVHEFATPHGPRFGWTTANGGEGT